MSIVPTVVIPNPSISDLDWSEFVTFAVFTSISAKRVLANLSSVIWSSPMYAVFIVVPSQTPVPIVPTVPAATVPTVPMVPTLPGIGEVVATQ